MTTESKRAIHPMMLIAGVSLVVFCAAGTAAVMGWIPSSIGHTDESSETAKVNQPAIGDAKTATEKPRHAWYSSTAHDEPVHVASKERITCADCGVIESIRTIETRGNGSGAGAVGGAVVGGLLGNQVGGGRGKDAMTVVGALGGALAGNQIERLAKSTTRYEIVVRMENGSSRAIQSAEQPSWQNGDRVKVIDGDIRSI